VAKKNLSYDWNNEVEIVWQEIHGALTLYQNKKNGRYYIFVMGCENILPPLLIYKNELIELQVSLNVETPSESEE